MKYKVIFEIETEIDCKSNEDMKQIIKTLVKRNEIIPYGISSTEHNFYELKFKKIIKGKIKK